jgi:hypothetical protein
MSFITGLSDFEPRSFAALGEDGNPAAVQGVEQQSNIYTRVITISSLKKAMAWILPLFY